MRIRKHSRISASSITPSAIVLDAPATQACELNRSPWDVISFSSQSEEVEHRVKIEEDNDTCNSMGREPESFACLEKRYWEQVSKTVKKEDVEIEEDEEEEKRLSAHFVKKKGKRRAKVKREIDYVRCVKTDGKGWYCKNEAQQGETLCEHHLIQLKSYIGKYNYSSKKSMPMQAKVRVGKTQTAKSPTAVAASRKRSKGKVPAASPADFYYYCGFGPSWGRRRGGEDEIKKEQSGVAEASDQATSSSSSIHAAHGHEQASSSVVLVPYDYDSEDDFDDDEDNGGKKRFRKPIKARSVNSLF